MNASGARLVKVKVRAGARRESFAENVKGGFDIAVKEPAEGNRANARVLALVARHFGVSARSVRIVSGRRAPGKILRVAT